MNSDNKIINIGEKLKRLRLNADLTQQELANQIGVGRKTIQNAELGKTKLNVFVAILSELGQSEIIEALATKPPISPVQLAKLESNVRKRASGGHKKKEQKNTTGDLKW